MDKVAPGQLIMADLDLVLGNDITTPVAVREFEKIGAESVFDKSKVAIVPDHFTPNKDIKSAEQCRLIRNFARSHEIENYFEIGQMGIEHALIPEKGPGGSRRCGNRRRFPYLYIRGLRRFLHRCGQHGYGSGNGLGPVLVQGAGSYPL